LLRLEISALFFKEEVIRKIEIKKKNADESAVYSARWQKLV